MGKQIESLKPRCSFADLRLEADVYRQIHEIMEDLDFAEALRAQKLTVRKKILLHGPSGCGKTSIAHAIADYMGLLVASVSMAETVGGHVGETEKAITAAVRYGAENRCVLLLDEFDSIGRSRGGENSGASTSLDRGVNSLLVELEGKPQMGMLVACTNLFDEIDKAILRRFDLILEIPEPSEALLRSLAESIIAGRFNLKADDVLKYANTPAMVTQVANALLRREVIKREKANREVTMPLFGTPGENVKAIISHLEKPKQAEATQ